MINIDKLEPIQKPYDQWHQEAYDQCIQYLSSTDWQVIAKYERKRPIPDEVQAKRKAALDVVTAEPVALT
ncbi:hypothetical protein [Pseudomonas edaphica]|uniref:hypothetical protein n=1 Tax=Pseudomonas edaphica TaxID=2006980 RepID=UPI003D108077